MIRVGVVGAAGRMGQEVCRAIEGDSSTELVAEIDQGDSLDLLTANGAEVVVDFTVRDVARETLAFAAANHIHAVVGTTGFSDDDLDEVRARFTTSNALIAPNFAIGAVLMIRMAELAAPHFETAEIIEFHHHNKLDAPSGTATHTAERMAAASADWPQTRRPTRCIPALGVELDRAVSGSTASGWSVRWRTRRSFSARWGRHSRFVTTPLIARPSCPVFSSR